MKDSSAEWKEYITNDKRTFIPKAEIVLKNGTTLPIDNSKIMKNGLIYSGGTSESGVFSIGSAISAKVTLVLNNMYGDFDQYDFTGAIVKPFVGMALSTTNEWLKFGIYTAEPPEYNGSVISLECLDNLAKTDIKYAPSVTFPCSRLALIEDICTQCNIYLNTKSFHGYGETVQSFDHSNMTCRQVISYVAQIGCLYAYCDVNGYLNLGWYATTVLDSLRSALDGGSLEDYTSGSTADGGTFTNYNSGAFYDGGTFQDQKKYAVISALTTQNICTDDVVITGTNITYTPDTEDAADVTVKVGNDGYRIAISENPLINSTNVDAIINYIYSQVGGLRFRPLNVGALSDPRIEPGDICIFIDRKQISYPTLVTNLRFTLGEYENFISDAQTPSRNSADNLAAATSNLAEARKNTAQQISTYDKAVQRLTSLITNSFGIFNTKVKQQDGSTIYYMHNKPELSNSSIIFKMAADGFAVSRDGGLTYIAGFDSSGNAVLNILDVIGINADWINVGKLLIGGNQNNVDGVIEIHAADGTLLASFSKSGVVIHTGNFDIDSSGNTTIKGNIYANGALYLYSAGFGYNFKFIDVTYSTEDSIINFYDRTGAKFMYYSEQVGLHFHTSTTSDYDLNGTNITGTTVTGTNTRARTTFQMKDPRTDNVFFNLFQTAFTSENREVRMKDPAGTTVIKTSENDSNVFYGVTSSSSDMRLKDVQENIDAKVYEEKLKSVLSIIFKWKKNPDGQSIFGFSAQNLLEIFGNEMSIVTEDESGYLSVNYSEMLPILVSIINLHAEEIAQLKAKQAQQEEIIKLLCGKVGVDYGNTNA
jgi:hypothetical protein